MIAVERAAGKGRGRARSGPCDWCSVARDAPPSAAEDAVLVNRVAENLRLRGAVDLDGRGDDEPEPLRATP